VSYARIGVVAAAVALAVMVWRTGISAGWLAAPLGVFVWLVRYHDRVLRSRETARRAIDFYERGLARIEDGWIGTGEAGERFRDDTHPFAIDLDLFGRGSLFQLLSQARTRTGEALLARWLTTRAEAAAIRERQAAVAELGARLDFREPLAAAGSDIRASVHTDRLLEWAEAPVIPRRALAMATWTGTALTVAATAYTVATSSWGPLAAIVLLQALAFGRLRGQTREILAGSAGDDRDSLVADALTHRVRDLDVVAELLTQLEGATFASGRLATLRAALLADAHPASRCIRRLHHLAEVRDWERNLALFPLGLFLGGYIDWALAIGAVVQLMDPHIALAVDRWRRRHGASVRVWIDTIAEFEALASLAAYHFEHPADPFPEVLDARAATYDGVQIGHPLLPAAGMVANDVRLGEGVGLLVVSGSNMSGKSTLLRTVGINAVLAFAGAPVRAASLRIAPMALGATLRIQDSLQEGRSRFYAEITRLRELSDLANGAVPLLFLLDELFHGTNSHDRLAGARGVLGSFLERGAIGLVTTHDLALTVIADHLAPRAANVHFDDTFDEGGIRFDYRVKPGPVTHSNALALMRAVGLDVPAE
jgi:hypothetical protein